MLHVLPELHYTSRAAVAQVFDFASIIKKVGALSFAYFAKGGYYEL